MAKPSMRRAMLQFGEWMPDRSTRQNPANEAKGVISQQNMYTPLRSPQNINGTSAATATTCKGIYGFYDSAGTPQVFMGDTSKIYRIEGRTAVNRSKTGGYVSTADKYWVFEQFGTSVYAVFPAVNTQSYNLGVSTQFADVSGAPQGEAMGRVREFMMIGNGQTLSWSAFNDPTSWTPSAATQAGTTTLELSAGNIKVILGGETGTVFQERQINRMTYVGPPTIWQRDVVEERRGALSQRAAVKFGRNIFYVSDDGFWVFDGYQSQPIGMNKVDGYFTSRLNYPYRGRVCTAWDPINRALICAYPANGSATLNEMLIYSLTDNRWTHDDISAEFLGEMPLLGYNLDTLDTYPGANGMDLPSLGTLSIDSPVFTESRRQPAIADMTHALSVFSGTARPAILETQEFESSPGRHTFVNELWPIVDAPYTALSASVLTRPLGPGDGATQTNVQAANATGMVPVRADGRFARARVYVAQGAAWDHAEGVEYRARVGGAR